MSQRITLRKDAYDILQRGLGLSVGATQTIERGVGLSGGAVKKLEKGVTVDVPKDGVPLREKTVSLNPTAVSIADAEILNALRRQMEILSTRVGSLTEQTSAEELSLKELQKALMVLQTKLLALSEGGNASWLKEEFDLVLRQLRKDSGQYGKALADVTKELQKISDRLETLPTGQNVRSPGR